MGKRVGDGINVLLLGALLLTTSAACNKKHPTGPSSRPATHEQRSDRRRVPQTPTGSPQTKPKNECAALCAKGWRCLERSARGHFKAERDFARDCKLACKDAKTQPRRFREGKQRLEQHCALAR